jgi:LuxR family maltose regulon positive regulatory protein
MNGGQAIVARTKFGVPHIPNATIRRDALLSRLDEASARQLSLVVAAPGSGKTALLTQWVDGLSGPVAWLTCDASDSGAGGFWANLSTAIRSAWSDMECAPPPSAANMRHHQLATWMANELGALGGQGVIVVDDFHLAGAGPVAMRAFIDALPPGVRLVVGSRCDPPFSVSRLRLQGRLLELRQAELRFTTTEVRQLLTAMGVEVEDADLEKITHVTEGWTAAVHLAGLWLRAHRDPPGLLGGLLGTDRSLVDFLVNEVVDSQPPEIVDFLTVTAELETFDPVLCDAVRKRKDSGEMLRRVDAANLFLVPLDGLEGGYRYHNLFAQFLRGRLRAMARQRVPAIHRAAADAYDARGDLMTALHHRMEAGDAETALARLQPYVTAAWAHGDQWTGGDAVRSWLHKHGRSQLESSPHSVLASTIVLNATGRGDDAEPWLRHADEHGPELDPEARALLHGAWSFHLLQRGDPAGALARVRRAEAVLGEVPTDSASVEALPSVVIQASSWMDDLEGAQAAIDAARRATATPVASHVWVPGFDSYVHVLRGELTEAQRLATSALAEADDLGLDPASLGRAEPLMTLAMLAIEWNQLDEADARLEQLTRSVSGGRRPLAELLAYLHLALVAGARGDARAACGLMRQARSLLPHAASPVTARINQVDLRLALDRGDYPTAEEMQQRLPPSATSALLTARVCLAAGDDRAALDVLDAVAGRCSTRRLQVEHGVLTALAVASTDPARARETLCCELARAEPVGFERTFVAEGPALWGLLESLPAPRRIADYIARLLDAARHVVTPTTAGPSDGIIDPLSDRELTVLRYLSSRLTSAEIAQELHLSVNTVRSHVKAIYRKLGVNVRHDAVERGHALHLKSTTGPVST